MLHLSGHHGDATPGAAVFVRIAGIAALQAELLARQYPNARPGLVEQDWGTTMNVADPFGKHLRFCEGRD